MNAIIGLFGLFALWALAKEKAMKRTFRVKATCFTDEVICTGEAIDPWYDAIVALPAHSALGAIVTIQLGERHASFYVRDVGPWNARTRPGSTPDTQDPYWDGSGVPQASSGTDLSGRRTNGAGIDLTPAAWLALGVPREYLPNYSAIVEWWFE